jgi:hypothetical protein
MLFEPGEPALPFGQQFRPFLGTPSLFGIPLVEVETRMATGFNFVLAIQSLLDIDMVQKSPAHKPEMLGGSIHGIRLPSASTSPAWRVSTYWIRGLWRVGMSLVFHSTNFPRGFAGME